MTTQDDVLILGKPGGIRVMRRFIGYIHPYRRQVTLAIIATLALTALSIIPPYLTKIAIDRYIGAGNVGGLIGLTALYVGILGGEFALGYAITWLLDMTGQKIMRDIRIQVFRHVQRLDVAHFDRMPVGQLMTRITSDVEALNELFAAGVVTAFADLLSLIGIIVILFLMNFDLALVMFSVMPLLFVVTLLFKINIGNSFRRIRAAEARINEFLHENISGAEVVRLFASEKKRFDRFTAINREYLKLNLRSTDYSAIYYPLLELIWIIAVALVLWYGGVRVASGAMTLGVLVAFLQYSERFFHPISGLSEKYTILQAAMAASERIFRLLDIEPSISSPGQPQVRAVREGRVEFRDVSFAYKPGEPVIDRLSFRVEPGERLAIVGATGAGKSTIIHLLTRFYDAASGEILVDGVDVRRHDLDSLRRSIGMVLQDVFLFSGTIADNIRLGNPAMSDDEVRRVAETVRCDRFIRRLKKGYGTRLGERGLSLSVGQRQLLSFARALAMDPKILVLDEATSSIDGETELQIQEALEELLARRTSIVIAHRLNTISKADRIIVMSHGRIREAGSHQELLRLRGIYWKLCQTQTQASKYSTRL